MAQLCFPENKKYLLFYKVGNGHWHYHFKRHIYSVNICQPFADFAVNVCLPTRSVQIVPDFILPAIAWGRILWLGSVRWRLLLRGYRRIQCARRIFVFTQDDWTHQAEILHEACLVKFNTPLVWQAPCDLWLFPNLKTKRFPYGISSAAPPAHWLRISPTLSACRNSLLKWILLIPY